MLSLSVKNYELSNHLGNVLTTVTGRKQGIDNNGDGKVDHYEPEIVQSSDYYPFGSEMPGRTYKNPLFLGTNEYRFGFNGKELDKSGEFGSLSHYDYGEQVCSSHTKWLVDAVKRSFRPAAKRGAISEVKTLCALAKVLLRQLGFITCPNTWSSYWEVFECRSKSRNVS